MVVAMEGWAKSSLESASILCKEQRDGFSSSVKGGGKMPNQFPYFIDDFLNRSIVKRSSASKIPTELS